MWPHPSAQVCQMPERPYSEKTILEYICVMSNDSGRGVAEKEQTAHLVRMRAAAAGAEVAASLGPGACQTEYSQHNYSIVEGTVTDANRVGAHSAPPIHTPNPNPTPTSTPTPTPTATLPLPLSLPLLLPLTLTLTPG